MLKCHVMEEVVRSIQKRLSSEQVKGHGALGLMQVRMPTLVFFCT